MNCPKCGTEGYAIDAWKCPECEREWLEHGMSFVESIKSQLSIAETKLKIAEEALDHINRSSRDVDSRSLARKMLSDMAEVK